MATKELEVVAPGDVIEVTGRRVGDTARAGEILEVLGSAARPYYRVRWDDGHETVFFPGSGTVVRHEPPLPRPELEAAAGPNVLVEHLRESHVEFELLPHRRTLTAAGEARALGVLPQETAKTVIARDETGANIRAVVPASSRLDLRKLAHAVEAKEVVLLTESELAGSYPQFELGAVPPFSGPAGDRVVIDRKLANCEHIVLEAGVHDTSLRLRTEDLIVVADGLLADVAKE
ncbi:MAG TPA: YbaK/EbsC family protein [Gaiellaceae bacterium]|jgi:Ala-tRNA(Pro) deacylase|nr:YbaK/EbsC family protein [Gaiellaceae bacterium]